MADPPPQPTQQAARIAQQDEADLVARAVAGEREAFGILVERLTKAFNHLFAAEVQQSRQADVGHVGNFAGHFRRLPETR